MTTIATETARHAANDAAAQVRRSAQPKQSDLEC